MALRRFAFDDEADTP